MTPCTTTSKSIHALVLKATGKIAAYSEDPELLWDAAGEINDECGIGPEGAVEGNEPAYEIRLSDDSLGRYNQKVRDGKMLEHGGLVFPAEWRL